MLTELERRLIEVLRVVLDHLTGRSSTKTSYLELMGIIREVLRMSEAVEVGCSTGRHLGQEACHCPQDRLDFKKHKGGNHGE